MSKVQKIFMPDGVNGPIFILRNNGQYYTKDNSSLFNKQFRKTNKKEMELIQEYKNRIQK